MTTHSPENITMVLRSIYVRAVPITVAIMIWLHGDLFSRCPRHSRPPGLLFAEPQGGAIRGFGRT